MINGERSEKKIGRDMECERSLPISTRKERGLKLSKVLGLLNQTHKFLSRFWIVGKYPTHGTSTAPTRF